MLGTSGAASESGHKKHDRQTGQKGWPRGESKRALAAGAGGILRTGPYIHFFLLSEIIK